MRKSFIFMIFFLICVYLYGDSLWNASANGRFKGFIKNTVELHVGDVVYIYVYETPTISLSESMANKKGGLLNGINSFMSNVANFDLSKFIPINNNPDTPRKTSSSSKPKVVAQIAAVVKEIDEAGNYVIEGRKEIKIGNDLKTLVIQGIVRPEDVQSGNYVNSSHLANARIWYDGEIVFQQDPNEETWLGWILSGLANLFF